jgi:tRNA pseudouridine55 synthase
MLPNAYAGLLVVDKPAGLTSRDVVDRAARWFPRRTRLGHTGTLDPLATGVLVLCVGEATRLTEYVQRMRKTYEAGILLGARSTTDDADGDITRVANATPPDRDQVDAALVPFIGRIGQVPPPYSAARVAGRRAYQLARSGKTVDLAPRDVEISRIELLEYDYPRLRVKIQCGKGTYIRSLARDLGEALGCGAMVETLRRTSVGCFKIAQAITLDVDATHAHSHLLPLASAVSEMQRVTLGAEELTRLRQGMRIPSPVPPDDKIAEVAVFAEDGALAAIASVDAKERVLQPEKVLPFQTSG